MSDAYESSSSSNEESPGTPPTSSPVPTISTKPANALSITKDKRTIREEDFLQRSSKSKEASPSDGAPATMLAQILAIRVPDARRPKPPGYSDCDDVQNIKDMDPPASNETSDAEMIISLIHSSIIEDEGYVWADATELHRWIMDELTKRLNYFLDGEINKTSDELPIPILIRDVKAVSSEDIALMRWLRRDNQRKMNFRVQADHIKTLRKLDLDKDLSVYEMMNLVAERKERVDQGPATTNAKSTVTTPRIDPSQEGDGDSKSMLIEPKEKPPSYAQRVTRAALKKRLGTSLQPKTLEEMLSTDDSSTFPTSVVPMESFVRNETRKSSVSRPPFKRQRPC